MNNRDNVKREWIFYTSVDYKMWSTVLILCLFCFPFCSSEGFNDSMFIQQHLSTFYSNNGMPLHNMIPVKDASKPLNLKVMMFLYSVDGFDAVNGEVEISGALYLEWQDETFDRDIGNYPFSVFNEGYSVMISPKKIWTPSVILLNAADTVKNVGGDAFAVRYHAFDGRVKWQPRTIIKASCSPNVEFYPFDRQTCSFTYTTWGYKTSEIIMDSSQSDWYLCDYVANGIWKLVSTYSEQFNKNDQTFMKFVFTIERAPKFFIINIVCPIVLLGVLNGFVFFMPAESGERVGFSITCFLSFVFILQTVMGVLPQTAEPMSRFCFYVVVMMLLSIVLSILTVLTLIMYHRPEDANVPKFIQKFIRFVRFGWLKKKIIARCGKRPDSSVSSSVGTSESGFDGSSGIEEGPEETESEPGTARSVSNVNIKDTPEPLYSSGFPKGFHLRQDTDLSRRPFNKRIFGGRSAYNNFGRRGNSSLFRNRFRADEKSISDFEMTELKVPFPAMEIGSDDGDMDKEEMKDEVKEEEPEEMKWPDVARSLDAFFFFSFIVTKIALAFIFIYPLATAY